MKHHAPNNVSINNVSINGHKPRVKGFTLIELMIVVVIVSILAAIAIPSYQNQVQKTRRADAQGALTSFANAMERHFTQNNTYLGAANGGADTGAPDATVFATQAPLDGDTKYYNLTISAATASSYTLLATPIAGGAQDGDGALRILSSGARAWDEAGDGSWSKSW